MFCTCTFIKTWLKENFTDEHNMAYDSVLKKTQGVWPTLTFYLA